jgi:hypothetical protein
MKRSTLAPILIAAFFGLSSCLVYAEDERTLLAEMLKARNELEEGPSIKRRITLYETLSKNYANIIDNYSETDIGLELIARETYEGVDFGALLTAYIEELGSYYKSVCKDSPSYACLGFVTMEEGYSLCRSEDPNQSVEGAFLIRKSAEIFRSSGIPKFSTLALDALRACSRAQSGELKRGVEYQVVAETISTGTATNDFEPSVAAIQRMDKRSAYHLLAVIDLTEAQGKFTNGREAKDRIVATISERFQSDPEAFRFASVHLWSAIFRAGAQVRPMDLAASREFACSGSPTQFDTQKQNELMNGFIVGVQAARRKESIQFNTSASDVKTLGESLLFMTCGFQSHLWEAKLYYLAQDRAEDLNKIQRLEANVSRDDLHDFEVANIIGTEKELAAFLTHRNLASDPSRWRWQSQKQLDEGNVCQAVGSLLKAPNEQFRQAIDYLLQSPNFIPTQTYDCGDEDLTLLLGE